MDEKWTLWLLNQKWVERPNDIEIEEYVYANILTKNWYWEVFEEINNKIEKIDLESILENLKELREKSISRKKYLKRSFSWFKDDIVEVQKEVFKWKTSLKDDRNYGDKFISNYVEKNWKDILTKLDNPENSKFIKQAFDELDNLIKVSEQLEIEWKKIFKMEPLLKSDKWATFLKNNNKWFWDTSNEETALLFQKFIKNETSNYFSNIEKFEDFFNIVKESLWKAFSNLEKIQKLVWEYQQLDWYALLALKENEKDLKDFLKLVKKSKESFLKISKSLHQYNNVSFNFEWIEELAWELKKSKLLKNFLSSEEILARMVDSLISWYTWKLSANNYPLAQKDLEFLWKFKFEWKKIFWEHIEKYRENILSKKS